MEHEEWCEGGHVPDFGCWEVARMRRLSALDVFRCTHGQYHWFESSDLQAPCAYYCGTVLADITNYRSTLPTPHEYLRRIRKERDMPRGQKDHEGDRERTGAGEDAHRAERREDAARADNPEGVPEGDKGHDPASGGGS